MCTGLLLWSNGGCLVCLVCVAVFTTLQHHLAAAPYFTVLALSAFMLFYPVVASVSNIVAGEIVHQKLRSCAFTIGLLAYSIVGFLSTFTYYPLKKYFGVAGALMPFIFALCLTLIIYYFYLPETRGRTFESLAFHASEC
jgi:hypothetical protein